MIHNAPVTYDPSTGLSAQGAVIPGYGLEDVLTDWNKQPQFTDAAQYATDKIATDREAAHFAHQVIMGPTWGEIQGIKAVGSRKKWVRAQFDNTPPPRIIDLHEAKEGDVNKKWANGFHNGVWSRKMAGIWWRFNLDSDPMRGKIVWALAKHFPVSQYAGAEDPAKASCHSFTDMLSHHAYGNFVDILEAVTYHQEMGKMLTYVGNEKASADGLREPDENYAREIMQLFTIGLHELNIDGTNKLDGEGNTIPTYTNDDIRQVARVFTGLWRPALSANQTELDTTEANKTAARGFITNSFGTTGPLYCAVDGHLTTKMKHALWAYEYGAKLALGGQIDIPADTAPTNNIRMFCEQIAAHPSCAPFIAKQFIKMLVKSNPSPAYVARVAQAFRNNGRNVVGDLKTVWQAIFCDSEAAYPGSLDEKGGRWMDGWEVLMRHMRTLERSNTKVATGTDTDGRYVRLMGNGETLHVLEFGFSMPYNQPSIFGGYDQIGSVGSLIDYGLEAPEATGWNASTMIGAVNSLWSIYYGYNAEPSSAVTEQNMNSDYTMLPTTGTEAELIERLNLLFFGGCASPALIAGAAAAIAGQAASTETEQINRATAVILYFATSCDFFIQY